MIGNLLRTTLFLLFLIFLPCEILAQILNIENFKTDTLESKNYLIRLTTSLDIEDNSKKIVNFENDLYLIYNRNLLSTILISSNNISDVGSKQVVGNGYIHLRFRWQMDTNLAIEEYQQYQFDKPRGLLFRQLVGLGIRCNLLNSDFLKLDLSNSVMYESEKWKPKQIAVLKNQLKHNASLQLSVNVFDKGMFYANGYYQAPYSGLLSPRAIFDSVADFAINNHISLSLNGSLSYDIKPVLNVKPFIYAITLAMSFSL